MAKIPTQNTNVPGNKSMKIMSSTNLINRYDELSKMCKWTDEPIYLSKDGKCDLVVMSVETYEKHLALLNLKERLLDIESEQLSDAKSYSLDELDASLKEIVDC